MAIHFEWTKEISVDNEIIDGQHKRLLSQINIMLDEIFSGVDHEKVKEVIEFLDKYIQEHFTYEETYMTNINYPHLEEHKKLHHDFIQKYYKFKDDFNTGVNKEALLLEIEGYIGLWWVNHIGKEDKKYQLFWHDQNKKIK